MTLAELWHWLSFYSAFRFNSGSGSRALALAIAHALALRHVSDSELSLWLWPLAMALALALVLIFSAVACSSSSELWLKALASGARILMNISPMLVPSLFSILHFSLIFLQFFVLALSMSSGSWICPNFS